MDGDWRPLLAVLGVVAAAAVVVVGMWMFVAVAEVVVVVEIGRTVADGCLSMVAIGHSNCSVC